MSAIEIALEEPLSPELALVCPELAERARQLLPDPGWLAPVVRVEASGRIGPLQTLALASASLGICVTPLVLVVFAGGIKG